MRVATISIVAKLDTRKLDTRKLDTRRAYVTVTMRVSAGVR